MGHVVHTGQRRRTNAAGAVLTAALLCAGAVGCGTEKSDGNAADGAAEGRGMTPAAAVKAAARNTEKLTSLRYRMTGRTPEEGRVEGEGAMSFESKTMRMKVRALDQGADASFEIRVVGKVMYMGADKASAAEMDGKRWLKLDLSALGKGGSGDTSTDALAGQADKNPAAESTFLSDADEVRRVGKETIDGVSTTHYRGTVTLDQMRASLKGEDAETRERRTKNLKQFEDMGVDRLSMDMWVDGNHHTKRFRMRGKGDKGPLDTTITFLDINKPVTVQAPPASETHDLAEPAQGAEG
ncbi:DUF1396 domain-containing protein [Streptomyces sp. NA02950]|uniref:DUF1396 domain-containing protein n=1 Tax=Streptomyces sp. NA02950 TaxID=2742137 RepID=UPI001591A110|nr:DUF1396 domain-containing protein [Streptomyces sp. NA02950]QKV93484.1 DUF1396 domain-containing protein [Streptomyces sp. NA02950]